MSLEQAWTRVLDPAVAIAPQIYRILRERIVRHDLAPGDRISESEIARHYGVSRQPVREAFIKLADQGLLTVQPQRGTVIRKIDYAAVLDGRFIRESVEADIVRLLARKRDPAIVRALRDQIRHQREIAAGAALDFIRLDETFHRTMADGAGSGGAWRLVEGLKSQMDRVRFLSLTRFPVEKVIRQHTEIVDAIEHGGPRRAELALRRHLREVLKDLPPILRAHPDYFHVPKTMEAGNDRR